MAIPKNTPISATSEKPKPDEKKATEAVKAATDSKAAPAASPVKPDEKKPAEASKTATDGKAAPSVSPVKPDEKKPTEDTKTATDGKAAPAAPADKSDEKNPTEASKVVNFPASADKDKSKAEKPDAPDEDEYDAKDIYDENGAYLSSFTDEVYATALDKVLADTAGFYTDAEIELPLRYLDGAWRLQTTPALISALMGGV